MVMGKLGAFLNKDMGALVKDAGKVLNTDLGTIAKGAGRVLKSDLGDLMRDAPEAETPATAPVSEQTAAPAKANPNAVPTAAPPSAAPAFDPDVTQKMDSVHVTALPGKQAVPVPATFDPDVTQKLDRTPATGAAARPFDPDVTQKMDSTAAATKPSAGKPQSGESAAAASPEVTSFNEDLLLRTKRAVPAGKEVKVLLPHSIGDFERPRATPSGELTNDPVNAAYSGHGESVLVQLALCWDADEAQERIDEMIARIGVAARIAPDRSWVIGPQAQGVICAWTRDCYYFSASAQKGAPALARFLWAYPF